jgi:hypothetical protein
LRRSPIRRLCAAADGGIHVTTHSGCVCSVSYGGIIPGTDGTEGGVVDAFAFAPQAKLEPMPLVFVAVAPWPEPPVSAQTNCAAASRGASRALAQTINTAPISPRVAYAPKNPHRRTPQLDFFGVVGRRLNWP